MALIECTTLARVKEILSLDVSDTSHDDYLNEAIEAVSARIETFIDRPIESASRTEEYDVHSVVQETIFLRALPVTAVTSVKSSVSWDFASTTAIDSTLYRVVAETGELHMRTQLSVGPKSVQVVYTGGLAADTASLIDDYPAIADACDKQVVAQFRRRQSPQGQRIEARDGSITHERALSLLEDVKQALIPYRRFRFGV